MESSSIGKLLFCSISKHSRILYSYNARDGDGDGDGDGDLETLASLCIEKAPPFHSHYFHTAGDRTFGFLIDGALTYFAIVDRSPNKSKILQLLHQIRNSYKKSNSNFDEELVPIIKRLICSLESMNHGNNLNSNCYGSIDGSSSTKAPLLGKSSAKIDESNAASSSSTDSLMKEKSLSFSRRDWQVGRELWWRHVKIVVAADVFLCLVLFGIWLAICRGFQCLS